MEKKKNSKRIGLKTEFIVWFILISLIPLIIISSIVFNVSKRSLTEQGEEHLKNSVEIIYQIADDYNNRVKNDEMAIYFAQDKLREELLGTKNDEGKRKSINESFVIGEGDFLFAYNSSGTAVMHPEYEGLSFHGDEIVEKIIAQKEGFLNYTYIDSSGKSRAVILYMTYFEPWDWIIVNNTFEDNFNPQVEEVKSLIYSLIILIVILIVVSAIIISRKLVKPINDLSETMTLIGTGDLTKRVYVKTKNELGILADNMNKASESVKLLLEEVKNSGTMVLSSSNQLNDWALGTNKSATKVADLIEKMDTDLKTQEKNVDNIFSIMEELAASYQEISASTEEVKTTSYHAKDAGENGMELIDNILEHNTQIVELVNDSGEKIGRLREHSYDIGNIIDLITEISDQTNLLAINASIEAARAGTHGRGFAVVADEVKKLAEGASKAADDVREKIEIIQKDSEQTFIKFEDVINSVTKESQLLKQTEAKFGIIINSVNNVASQLAEVAITINEMATGTTNAVEDVSQIANVSNNISQSSENLVISSEEQVEISKEIKNSANELATMADNLSELISKFNIE